MQPSFNPPQFEEQWLGIAEEICKRVNSVPEVQSMKQRFKQGSHLEPEDISEFISIANRVKYEVVHELFGLQDSEGFIQFRDAWRHWFNNKGRAKFQLENRKLTNAEHIVYSSTPDPAEFFSNS